MFLIIYLIVKIFFVMSFHKTAKALPEKYHIFPEWMCWLIMIPGAGYIFEWILMPFGLPLAIKNYHPNNQALQNKRKRLFGVGLAYVIVLAVFSPFLLVPFGIIPAFILFIWYWIELVQIRALMK